MRSYAPAFRMFAPPTLEAALDRLHREPGFWQPFAGGTDLMVLFEAGKLAHRRFLSIWNLRELKGVEVAADHVILGALTTYTDVQRHAVLRDEFPLLVQAASETGGIATQNRGTLGGNIANASPAADSPPALLVYDAEIELASASGARWLPYHEFHTGYKKLRLRPDELLSRIRLPRGRKHWRQLYRKVGTRKAQAISKVCFAAAADIDGGRIRDVRLALASVAPVPLRCVKTEAILRAQKPDLAVAREIFSAEIAPIDDIRSTARYRRTVACNLLEQFLHA